MDEDEELEEDLVAMWMLHKITQSDENGSAPKNDESAGGDGWVFLILPLAAIAYLLWHLT